VREQTELGHQECAPPSSRPGLSRGVLT